MEDDRITIDIEIPDDKTNKKHKKFFDFSENRKNKNKEDKKKKDKKDKTKEKTNIDIYIDGEKVKSNKGKIIAIIVAVLLVIIILLLSPIFNIKEINVEGLARLNKDDVIAKTGFKIDNNIFLINKLGAKRDLLKETYVKDVKIKRKLPKTINIEITEEKPTFMIQISDSYIYINNQGYMLEISTDTIEVPIILGITTDLSNVTPGSRLEVNDLKKLNKLIQIMDLAKSFEIEKLITRIDITDESKYTLYLDSEGKVVYLGEADDLNTRMLPLKAILEKTQGETGEIFLDMDLNKQNPIFRKNI